MALRWGCLWAVLLAVVRGQTNRHVSLNGNDGNSGTIQSPFRTLQHCVNASTLGDRCLLRAGRYEEATTVADQISNTDPALGLTIAGYPGERAIIDGSTVLLMSWTLDSSPGCVYRSRRLTEQETVPWQLFVDEVPLTPARWPNARLDDLSVFRPLAANGSGPLAYSDKTSTLGHLVDDEHDLIHKPSMASSGIDFTDCVVVLPLGTMGQSPTGCLVSQHTAGQSHLQYTPPPGAKASNHANNPYFFEGHPKLLDTEAEWSFDHSSRQLMVWLPGCADPNKVVMRGKVRGFNLNLTDSQVALENITLFATTFGLERSGISLDNVTMAFPTFNKRTIGKEINLAPETWLNIRKNHSMTMRRSAVLFNDGATTFSRIGDNAVFEDNLFHGACYAVGLSATLDDINGAAGLLFERNTVEYFNCFTGITPPLQSTLRLNLFQYQGPRVDGACIHVHIHEQNGFVAEKNWMHDTTVKAIRFDRVNSATATWGVNGTAINNVWWRTGAAFFKGNNHTIENNTGFASWDDATGALTIMMYDPSKAWSKKGENNYTRIYNNAADSIFNVSGVLPATPATRANNLGNTDIADQLTDPSSQNFVPRAGSEMARRGVGAYQPGDHDPWAPGCTSR